MHIDTPQVLLSDVLRVSAVFKLDAALLFQPDFQVQVLSNDGLEMAYCADLSASLPMSWLPQGEYKLGCDLKDLELSPGKYRLRLIGFGDVERERTLLNEIEVRFEIGNARESAGLRQPAWSVESCPGTVPVEKLAWNRGQGDWFFSHFDHAALVVTDYLLQRHPLLKGRILDVGCGDGLIDLGVFWRMQPEEMVGIDPFRGYERLPDVLTDNGLPQALLEDPRLKFCAEDGNKISWPDNYFDVVISWGSLEHIAGGYEGVLHEIRRVLKNDGLLFVHPGLYYGALGNHLNEFFEDPFIHLKLSEEELREAVLDSEPNRMDRAGHIATPEEYWQWYTELNPIRVSDFETELRQMGFEPWRVALRSSDIIEYTPQLQKHSFQDLATVELYLSAWNRKN